MNRVGKIEDQIKELSIEELRSLRDWLAEYGADAWDRQFESDVASGKLDRLAERAIQDHEVGRSTKL